MGRERISRRRLRLSRFRSRIRQRRRPASEFRRRQRRRAVAGACDAYAGRGAESKGASFVWRSILSEPADWKPSCHQVPWSGRHLCSRDSKREEGILLTCASAAALSAPLSAGVSWTGAGLLLVGGLMIAKLLTGTAMCAIMVVVGPRTAYGQEQDLRCDYTRKIECTAAGCQSNQI